MTVDLTTAIQIALFVIATLVAVGAVCWRQLQRHRTATYFRLTLKDPDPIVRAEGAVAWSEYGLHRSAPALLALAESDADPLVLDTLAEAIRVRAWEPDSRPQIMRLREWSAAYHAAQSE